MNIGSLSSWGGTDLRFYGSQPDSNRSCKTMDTEPCSVSHGVPVYCPPYAGAKL